MSIVSDVVEINRECFTSDDKYSSEKYLSSLLDVGVRILTVKQGSHVVGYIIYRVLDSHVESLRRAVTKKARGKGYGLLLTRRLISISKKLKKDIYTYVSKTNLPSLNSNLKCGYRVENIDANWVYIRYKVKS